VANVLPHTGLKGGRLELFSRDQIYDFHLATLKVLDEVGVAVHDENAARILVRAGARFNERTRVAKIPQYLVEDAIRKVPKAVTLGARNPKWDLHLWKKTIYPGSGSCAVNVLDFNGTRRKATLKDLEDFTRLQDGLENVHFISPIVIPNELPPAGLYRRSFEAILRNTEKHILSQAENSQDVRDQLAMAAVCESDEAFHSRPIVSFNVCFVSPLKLGKTNTEVLLECAKQRIPAFIEADPQAGSTAPVTVVGTMVQQNAEILGAVTLAELANPGTPVIYTHAPSIMDMKAAEVSEGAPERGLFHAITAQVARSYGIPTCCVAGLTDSKTVDVQAGYEKAFQFTIAALCGYNLVYSTTGMLESCLTASYEQSVIDNEIYDMTFRMLRGTEISDKTLTEAVEVIGRVGPLGSHYLAQEHTRKNLMSEHWIPRVSNRQRWEVWTKEGSKGAKETAQALAMKILAEHHPQPLQDNVLKTIGEIALHGVSDS
jgi:trimethylamine--corrinoid protein Co-methyltransferase